MARTSLSVALLTSTSPVDVLTAGLVSTDAVNGNSFLNEPGTALLVKNTDAGTQTLSIVFGKKLDGVTQAANTIALGGASTVRLVGPFPPLWYANDEDGGRVYLDSTSANLKVKPIRKIPGR